MNSLVVEQLKVGCQFKSDCGALYELIKINKKSISLKLQRSPFQPDKKIGKIYRCIPNAGHGESVFVYPGEIGGYGHTYLVKENDMSGFTTEELIAAVGPQKFPDYTG